jgi:hypothetical protein
VKDFSGEDGGAAEDGLGVCDSDFGFETDDGSEVCGGDDVG